MMALWDLRGLAWPFNGFFSHFMLLYGLFVLIYSTALSLWPFMAKFRSDWTMDMYRL